MTTTGPALPPYPHDSGPRGSVGLVQLGWAVSAGVGWPRVSGTLHSWAVRGTRTWAWCCPGKGALPGPTVPDPCSQQLGKLQTGKSIFSFRSVVPGPVIARGIQETMGLAVLTQRVACGQGGSEGPALPFMPCCDLSLSPWQAGWPATYLGHGLGLGLGTGAGTGLRESGTGPGQVPPGTQTL